jgi:hypothetical protein
MTRYILMLLAVGVAMGCAPTGAARLEKIETRVGLLMPATSLAASDLGIVAWELRSGEPGTQITGVTADGERRGALFYTLMAHAGVDRSLLVMRVKLGQRGQLAIANDGTVVEDTLTTLPDSGAFLTAIDADFALMDGTDVVPYAGGGSRCLGRYLGTVGRCARAAMTTAACIADPEPLSKVALCTRAAVGIFGCGLRLWQSWKCARDSDPARDSGAMTGGGGSFGGGGASGSWGPDRSSSEPSDTDTDTDTSAEPDNPWDTSTSTDGSGTSDDDYEDWDTGSSEDSETPSDGSGTADDDYEDWGEEDTEETPSEGPGTADDDYDDWDEEDTEETPSGGPGTADDDYGDWGEDEGTASGTSDDDYDDWGTEDTNDDGWEDGWTSGSSEDSDMGEDPWGTDDSEWDDAGSTDGGGYYDDTTDDTSSSSGTSDDDFDDWGEDTASDSSGGDGASEDDYSSDSDYDEV